MKTYQNSGLKKTPMRRLRQAKAYTIILMINVIHVKYGLGCALVLTTCFRCIVKLASRLETLVQQRNQGV